MLFNYKVPYKFPSVGKFTFLIENLSGCNKSSVHLLIDLCLKKYTKLLLQPNIYIGNIYNMTLIVLKRHTQRCLFQYVLKNTFKHSWS